MPDPPISQGRKIGPGCDVGKGPLRWTPIISRLSSLGLALALVLAPLSLATVAHSQTPPRAQLTWSSTAGCPDEAGMRELVVVRMGYDPFVRAHPRVVWVELDERADVFVGVLRIADDGRPTGQRTLEGPDCLSVAEALATALGVVLDPSGQGRRGPPLPRAVVPEPVERPPRAAPVEGDEDEASPPTRFVVAAHALGSVGGAPEPMLGGQIAAGLSWDALRLVAELRVLSTLGAVGAGEADVSLVETRAGVTACAVVSLWVGCGGLDVGLRRIEANGVSERGPFESVLAQARVRSGVRLPLASGELSLEVELGAPFSPVVLELEGQPVWSSLPVSGALMLGGAVELP